jgi:hypothetical protein
MSTTLLARLCTSSAFNPPRGCWMTAMGSLGNPSALASTRPRVTNSVEQMVAVGTPRFSSAMASWILHDVHEPHSPTALSTTSHCASASSISVGAGVLVPLL